MNDSRQRGYIKRNDTRVKVKTMSGKELYCHPGAVRILLKERAAVISEVTLITNNPPVGLLEPAEGAKGDTAEGGLFSRGRQGKGGDKDGDN